jgi:hypothetical protein
MENAAPIVSVAGDVMLRYHSMKEKESQPFTDFLEHVHQDTDSILFSAQREAQTSIDPCLVDASSRHETAQQWMLRLKVEILEKTLEERLEVKRYDFWYMSALQSSKVLILRMVSWRPAASTHGN